MGLEGALAFPLLHLLYITHVVEPRDVLVLCGSTAACNGVAIGGALFKSERTKIGCSPAKNSAGLFVCSSLGLFGAMLATVEPLDLP